MSILAALLAQQQAANQQQASPPNAPEAPREPPPRESSGRVFLSEPVRASFELERIAALPRRTLTATPELVDEYSSRFRRKPDARLLPMQALALAEFEQLGACNVVASLGAGKTLVTALVPILAGATKPLFLDYARLLDKTVREFRLLAEDWHICHTYTFLSVECLSAPRYADYLSRLTPDLIVIDEAHSLANREGARFRRLRRYKEAHPGTRILTLTATPGEDLHQYAHIQALLLGEQAPVPIEPDTLREWGEALDVNVRGQRRPTGALARFSSGGAALDEVRSGVGRRIEETRGNVYSRSAESIDCSVYLADCRPDVDPITDELCEAAWSDMILPDGRCFEELYNQQTILKQLGAGYAKVLDPTPPAAWREARSLWSAFVREIVSNESAFGLDTPAQVKAAVRAGEIDDDGLLAKWLAIEPTFVPRTKTEWFDFTVLEFAAEWVATERGLVWVSQPTVGRRLAEQTGLPFFHANGVDPTHGSIEAYTGSTGAILAVRPNMLGRNLQDRWYKNLYITPPSSATELDQSIGRTARRGQRAPTVDVLFVLTVRENWNSIASARRAAEAERALGRNDSSRLLTCDWCVSDLATVNTWRGPRWIR